MTPFSFTPAKTRSIQTYDSPVPESSRWPTQGLTPTVRHVPPEPSQQLPTPPSFFLNSASHCEILTNRDALFFFLFFFFLVFSRLAVLSDAGPDAVLGQQAHDIWSRELGDARFAALGGSRRRRPRSVRITHFSFLFCPPSLPSFLVVSENGHRRLNSPPAQAT
jgi:hypothetical protein